MRMAFVDVYTVYIIQAWPSPVEGEVDETAMSQNGFRGTTGPKQAPDYRLSVKNRSENARPLGCCGQ